MELKAITFSLGLNFEFQVFVLGAKKGLSMESPADNTPITFI